MRLNYANKEMFDNLTEANKMSAKDIIGYKERVKKQHSSYIIYSSEQQKHLNTLIELTKGEN